MNRLRAHNIIVGMHPDERLYHIHEADGTVTQSFAWGIANGLLDIGYPVARRDDGALLVELPMETVDGRWRVWVMPEELEAKP
jgi:hypothetical protein